MDGTPTDGNPHPSVRRESPKTTPWETLREVSLNPEAVRAVRMISITLAFYAFMLESFRKAERVSRHKYGTFGGLIRQTQNTQRAEKYIREIGHGVEFTFAQFMENTGITESSIGRILLRLSEAGIIATYPHPQFHGKNLYRVAWPVLIRKASGEQVTHDPIATIPVETSPEVRESYTVRLSHPTDQKYWEFPGIVADSPDDAAEKARKSLKATVMKTWEL